MCEQLKMWVRNIFLPLHPLARMQECVCETEPIK